MIIRTPTEAERDDFGPITALVIQQAAHSRISGNLARCWSLDLPISAVGRADLFLATELHDIGYESESVTPLWNPRTQLPYSFQDLPVQNHLEVWREGVRKIEILSSYAAYFVSKHTTHLVEAHPLAHTPDEQVAVHNFMKEQVRKQDTLHCLLSSQKSRAGDLTPSLIDFQQKLVAIWDTLSLGLCGALDIPLHVLSADGQNNLVLSKNPSEKTVFHVDPWPFEVSSIPLRWEAKILPRLLRDQDDLHSESSQTATVFLETLLRPAF